MRTALRHAHAAVLAAMRMPPAPAAPRGACLPCSRSLAHACIVRTLRTAPGPRRTWGWWRYTPEARWERRRILRAALLCLGHSMTVLWCQRPLRAAHSWASCGWWTAPRESAPAQCGPRTEAPSTGKSRERGFFRNPSVRVARRGFGRHRLRTRPLFVGSLSEECRIWRLHRT